VDVTRDDVLKIAELAKLRFDEEELDSFTRQFRRILDYVEKLKEVRVEGVQPTSHVASIDDLEWGTLRRDEVHKSLSEEEALSGAPDAGSGHFKVPKVI
jgi:aspartyl-tRNA(Asn)/glutamyl-tRNA(Gln) amidotransferase subunit C